MHVCSCVLLSTSYLVRVRIWYVYISGTYVALCTMYYTPLHCSKHEVVCLQGGGGAFTEEYVLSGGGEYVQRGVWQYVQRGVWQYIQRGVAVCTERWYCIEINTVPCFVPLYVWGGDKCEDLKPVTQELSVQR